MTTWTWAGAHLPDIEGQGVYFAAPADRVPAISNLQDAGYAVVEVDGNRMTDAASARQTIATALKLQDSAASNADAFADCLTEVSDPKGRVMLVWNDAQVLLQRDLPTWAQIVADLRAASVHLWDPENDDDPENVVFETLLLVDGHGVRQLS